MLEPVPGEPAAVAYLGSTRALVIADYHAGLEVALRRDGVELPSDAATRREAVLSLLKRTDADRIVFLGDLATDIGAPNRTERQELNTLLTTLAQRVPVTIVKGNHDGNIEAITTAIDGHEIRVTPTNGVTIGTVGFVHGHTWPSTDVLEANIIVMGHEHPMVQLTDEVGGHRAERVWLRGSLRPEPFAAYHDIQLNIDGELVVFPSFNDRTGGTWINTGQTFLAPYLPDGIGNAHAYLLNGTRLGRYGDI